MKEAYYFSHDSNAHNDPKILCLLAAHGWEGYGFYWLLIELMYEDKETALNHSHITGIAFQNRIDITLLSAVIKTCIEVKLFVSDDVLFWSESLRKRKNKYEKQKAQKSAAGRNGMAKRWGTNNTVITENNAVITENNKGKERKGNNILINENGGVPKKREIFIPPTSGEVADYFKLSSHWNDEEKNNREAKKFFLHYESNGWMVGRNKMKNWKSAASGWISRDNSPATIKPDTHNSFSKEFTRI